MGSAGKLWVRLGGTAMLRHALTLFEEVMDPSVRVLVVAASELDRVRRALAGWSLAERWALVPGGRTRQESEAAGVWAAVGVAKPPRRLLVHDASRPFVRPAELEPLLADQEHACTPGWPASGPVAQVDGDERVLRVLPGLWALQTPQAFPGLAFAQAHQLALVRGFEATDGVGVWAAAGGKARLVMGSPWNLKVTTPADLVVARRWWPLWRAGATAPPHGQAWAGA
jgi:2-C-methyl-D-erythritol 4-phosphate cytidylyltransferase